jgi:hypothetical protein
MTHRRSAVCMTVATLAAGLAFGGAASALQRGSEDNKKPSVAFKATPPVGFAPLKVRVVVDVKGGADDYADFYCGTVEWDWADGTVSGGSEDCEPYEAGKSVIQRRFTADHTFRQSGDYDVAFRLKQKSRIVGYAKGTVRVKAGVHDDDFDR